MQLWNDLIQFLVTLLVSLHDVLASLNLSEAGFLGNLSWGLTIVLFTLVMRVITFPLNMQQIRSSKAMQTLQPQLKELQKQYGKDRERLMQEQMRLYKEAKINPMLGCLPLLIQMPVWMALYGAINELASKNEGFRAAGFLWLPSLAQAEAAPYIFILLTGLTQWVVQRMMTPTTSDAQQKQMNMMMQFMPIMFIVFAFQVPSGLVIYWVTSNIFSIVQQYFMMGWGGLFPLPWQRATSARSAIVQPSLPAANGKQPSAGSIVGRPDSKAPTVADLRGPGGGKKRKIRRR